MAKGAKHRKSFFAELRQYRSVYVLLLPALLYTIVFGYCTIPYMVIAFEKFNFRMGIRSPWAGLENFKFFFGSTRAMQVTWNTVSLNSMYLIVDTISALIVALTINECAFRRYAKRMQAIMLFPHFLSWVIVSYILYALLSREYGLVNRIMEMAGLSPVNWYNNARYWPGILVITHMLKTVGYNSVIYLAAITGIDENIYEAAIIDGASDLQRITRITIPLLMPTVCVLSLLAIGKLFTGDFTMYYSIIKDNGILLSTTDVIDTYVFRMLRSTGSPSMSMAIGMYQSVVGFVMVYSMNAVIRRFFPEGALF